MYGFGKRNKAFRSYMQKVKELFQDKPVAEAVEKFENTRLSDSNIADVKKSNPVGFERPDVLMRSIRAILDDEDIDRYDTYEVRTYNHPRIPIINNHPDIPDFRWCHADYASIPTKENLNILEFTSRDIENKEADENSESNES